MEGRPSLVATGGRWAAALLLAPCLLLAIPAQGNEYAVDDQFPLSLRALVDVRFVAPGRALSATDRGPGKWRYGGARNSGGSERVVRFALAQFALEPSMVLPGDIRAHLQINWEADIDDQGDFGEQDGWPRLIEASLRKEWGDWSDGFGLQMGVINPPLSLEHGGPARTPELTLTPSAPSSWLWEEGRVVGFEGEWWRAAEATGARAGVFLGFGWGSDTDGIFVARNGWILSDRLSGVNDALALPTPGRPETHVFSEEDGRPAAYVGGVLADPWQIGAVHLGYFDNLGDLGTADVWETRFAVAGLTTEPMHGISFVFQYLLGRTATRVNRFESTLNAWYSLVSYQYGRHRVSARYDDFEVHDKDGPPSTRDRGSAVTVAYLFDLGLRHRLAVEYITIASERPSSSAPDPSDDGWQLSYRFRY